jgi:hypothetical protein
MKKRYFTKKPVTCEIWVETAWPWESKSPCVGRMVVEYADFCLGIWRNRPAESHCRMSFLNPGFSTRNGCSCRPHCLAWTTSLKTACFLVTWTSPGPSSNPGGMQEVDVTHGTADLTLALVAWHCLQERELCRPFVGWCLINWFPSPV